MASAAKHLPERVYVCGKNIGFKIRQTQGLDLAYLSSCVFQNPVSSSENADNVSSYPNGFCEM